MYTVGTDPRYGLALYASVPYDPNTAISKFLGKLCTSKTAPTHVDPGQFLQIGPDLYLGPSTSAANLANHSCEPNCKVVLRSGDPTDIWLVTMEPVEEGEELVWDYSTSMAELEPDSWALNPCLCGSSLCRGTIDQFWTLPQDLQTYYIERRAVPWFVINIAKEVERHDFQTFARCESFH